MTKHEPGGRSVPPFDEQNTDHSNDPAPITRVRGAQQLLAVLPQMIGYHPDHSLVLVVTVVHSKRWADVQSAKVILSCRLDLPPLEDLPGAVQLMAPALQQSASGDLDEVRLLHVFGFDLPESPGGQVDERLVESIHSSMQQLADGADAHLHDLLLVRDRGKSVREVVASGQNIEPVTGWAQAVDPADVPAAADLVFRGRGALGSRKDLVALVRARDEDASRATGLALSLRGMQEPPDYLDGLRPLAAWVLEGQCPTARERALITLVLEDRWIRDALLARWVPDTFVLDDVLDRAQAAELRRTIAQWTPREPAAGLDRLLTLVSQVPRQRGAPLLTITGLMAWSAGEGTIANEACDLALEVDRDYVMAQLLCRALAQGVRPPMSGRNGGRLSRSRPPRRPAA